MPFLTLDTVTAQSGGGENIVHPAGTVLSDWELSAFAIGEIRRGVAWYRERFEELTEGEAHAYRVKATMAEQPHMLNGVAVPPPFDDYVGLHPDEIISRLRVNSLATAEQARRYELGGMKREQISGFVHPAEHEPFTGYTNMSVSEILDKLEIVPDIIVEEAKVYEAYHQNRVAITEFEKELAAAPIGAAA
jgi:hypothetical protein